MDIRSETSTAKTLRLRMTGPMVFLPGQHMVLRLTAPDGYSASRSYSVASAPDGSPEIELTVERLKDGEVSGFLHDDVVLGDLLEVRGPIGRFFVWQGEVPALLIGGGSGVVPLMSMLRFARHRGGVGPVQLLVSVRSCEELLYADELAGPDATVLYTRREPEGWPRPAGRISGPDIPSTADPTLRAYVCGSAGFADTVTSVLEEVGLPASRIRVERFGPTG